MDSNLREAHMNITLDFWFRSKAICTINNFGNCFLYSLNLNM